MIPRSITLQDFLSYKEATVDLSRGGMIALAGDNGAGKSALAVDALTWALWGESRARSDDDLVRLGADECRVTVVVDTSVGRYRIGRLRRLPKGSRAGVSALSIELLDLLHDGEAESLTAGTIRETQEVINRVVGLDGRTFINSACLVQGRADEFAQAPPKERKDVLVDILGLGRWQVWAGKAHEAQRKAEASFKGLQASLEASTNMLSELDVFEGQVAVAKDEVTRGEAGRTALQGKVDEARQLADAQRDRTAERTRLTTDVEALDSRARTERLEVEKITAQLLAVPEPDDVATLADQVATVKTKGEGWSELADRFNRRSSVEAEIDRWEYEVAGRAQDIADSEAARLQLDVPPTDAVPDQCPTCGQDLAGEAAERVEKVLAERRQLAQEQQERITHLREQKAVAEARLTALRNELDGLPVIAGEDVTAARAALDLLPSVTAQHAAAVAQLEGAATLQEALVARKDAHDAALVEGGQVRERLTILTVELEGEGDRAAALAAVEADLQNATARLAEAARQRDSIQGRIDQLRRIEEDAKETQKQADAFREDMELQAELERALGSNGVQALLIDSAIPQIVDEANALLALMSAGTTIDLRTQRPGKSTGREIETLDLIVADGSGVRPYESYSGGERFRIDFATRIGLSRLLARRAASPCKCLIVDEGFGSQDGRGRMALLEALGMVRDQFELVLVITHLDDMLDHFQSTVRVEKTANGSTAVLV